MTLDKLNEIKSNYKVLEIAVDFINPSYNISRAKHLDNSRYILCTLTENGVPRGVKTNESARIRLQKPDKTYVYNDCEPIEDGRVLITLTEQILAAEGNAVCDIQLTNEDTGIISSTGIVRIMLDKTAVDNSLIESSNEFNALNSLIAANKKLNDEIKAGENLRQSNELTRQNAETERTNAESARTSNENERIISENIRKQNEAVRQNQEADRQTNTAAAVAKAENAAKKADEAADGLQDKLDAHHFVLTEDKGAAGGVASLDTSAKIPIAELYDATISDKGITQLTDSISSTSTTTAATANSVKTAYDKSKSYTDSKITDLINSGEFGSVDISEQLDKKVDKVAGKELSTNDYTTAEKDKLSGIASGATKNTASTTTPKANGSASAGTESGYARGDHVHPAQSSVTGNAGTATKLEAARSIQTNLASAASASFDGSKNITPGVTGVLPVGNGGTGQTSLSGILSALQAASLNGGTVIPNGADLDDYNTCGTYGAANAASAATLLHCPIASSGFTMFVLKPYPYSSASTYRTQIIVFGHMLYIRSKTSTGVYSTWQQMKFTDTTYAAMTAATASAAGKTGLVPAPAAGAQTKYLRGDGTWQSSLTTQHITTAGTNLNSYTVPGIYYFGSDATPVNIPAGLVNGYLIVITVSTTNIRQIWCRYGTIDTNDHETYVRAYNGTVWSTWAKYITSKDAVTVTYSGRGDSEGTQITKSLPAGKTKCLVLTYRASSAASSANAILLNLSSSMTAMAGGTPLGGAGATVIGLYKTDANGTLHLYSLTTNDYYVIIYFT